MTLRRSQPVGLFQVPAAWCSSQSFLGSYWAEVLLEISFLISGELLALGCHGLLDPVALPITPQHGADTITLQHSTGSTPVAPALGMELTRISLKYH